MRHRRHGQPRPALANYAGFSERGFIVAGVVDIDPDKVGTEVGGVTVGHSTTWPTSSPRGRRDRHRGHAARPRRRRPPIALVAAGIRSILNFAPTVIDVPDEVSVRNVDLAVELQILAFHEGRRIDGRDSPTRDRSADRGSPQHGR